MPPKARKAVQKQQTSKMPKTAGGGQGRKSVEKSPAKKGGREKDDDSHSDDEDSYSPDEVRESGIGGAKSDNLNKYESPIGKKTKNNLSTESSKRPLRQQYGSSRVKKKPNIASTKSSTQGSSLVLPAILLLVGAVVAMFAVVATFSGHDPVLDWRSVLDWVTTPTSAGFCDPHQSEKCDEFLVKQFKDLRLKYNNQSSNTWVTLYAAALDHVRHQPDPQRPIVIMVYQLENNYRVSEILEDIASKYDSVLPPNKNYGVVHIEGESFSNSKPEEVQKQIQKVLENGFEREAQKVVIVHDFDKLPSCSVLTFHNYCNNEDAPYKDVAIILTVTAGDEKLSSDPSAPELEKAVSKLLHEKWKDCPEELPRGKIDAMLSRVANNVIILR